MRDDVGVSTLAVGGGGELEADGHAMGRSLWVIVGDSGDAG